MQHGYIDLGIDKIVMFGIAGSGKTCSLAALLGQSPPDIRCSTPLMERPVQVIVIFVDEETQWQKSTPDQVCQMIAQIIRSRQTAHRVMTRSTPSNGGQQQFNTTTHQMHPPLKEYADTSASKATSTPQTSSALLASRGVVFSSNVSESKESPIAQSTSQGILDSLLESSHFEEEFVELINNSDPSSEPILRQNWLYIIDSGGQHEFHEVLPIFLNEASDFIYVFKVHESVDERPHIAFYDCSGKLLCEPHPSYLTNKEIFKQCMRTMYSFVSKSKKDNTPPQILLLGTHRDMVKEKDLPKVLQSLNKQLKEILLPQFKEQVIFCDKNLQEMIFSINAKQPERRDRECVEAVRRILTNKLGTRRVNVPLRWHALEHKLRQIAKAMKVTVLSKLECQKIAHSLHINNESCEEALTFFNGLNLLFYFPAILPNVVFIESQVILDKVSELVKESHQMKQENPIQQPKPKVGEWHKFRDYGQVTKKFLSDDEFTTHYREPIFTPEELITLFKALLVFAELSSDVWFMPSLLEVVSKNVESHRVSYKTALVIHFLDSGPQNGMFCSMVSFILSPDNHHCSWEVLNDKSGRPKCLERNVMKFKVVNFPGSVTLIDCFTHFEVHVKTQPTKEVEVWKLVKLSVFAGLKKASEILGYVGNFKAAIICPKHSSTPHPAVINDEGEWICSNDNEVFGTLENKDILWLAPGKAYIMHGRNHSDDPFFLSPHSHLHFHPSSLSLSLSVSLLPPPLFHSHFSCFLDSEDQQPLAKCMKTDNGKLSFYTQ